MYPNSQIYQSGIFVHEQVKALLKLGVNIVVYAPIPFSPFPFYLFSKKWKKLKNIPKYENIDGVEIIHTRYFALPTGFLKQYWSYPLSYFIKRELKKSGKLASFNIIHAHGSIPDDYSALLLSKSLKLPYIITVHGETVFMKKKNSHLQKSIAAINKADFVVGVSEKVINLVKLISGRKEKLVRIYNGFSVNEIEIPAKSETDYEVKILFGASLIERKGCEYVIRAFSKLLKENKKIKLTVAGGGELFNHLKTLTKELDIDSHVDFLGTVTHSEMLKQMASCDIFVLPSWNEALGVVYLEAMSFKKPVIGTIDEGISEIIKEGKNGFLVQPKSVDCIIKKMSLLIDDKNLRETIGNNGYESIKNMTWESNAQEMIQIYNEIKHTSVKIA